MRFVIAAMLAAVVSGPAVAQEIIGTGQMQFMVSCDADDLVLTPTENPESRPIRLRRDCVALSPDLGRGSWNWAPGGTVIQFKDARLSFDRQRPFCPINVKMPDVSACRY